MAITAPKIYVAGHRGMVGSAIVRQLLAAGHAPESIITRTHAELDLTDQAAVRAFFHAKKPDQVFLAAAKVGGIHANNTYPAEFIYQNLMLQANVIDAAFQNGVKKLLFLGSSCIYPRQAPQPMAEDALLTGTLEPTNEPYAIAKIAGIKLCESYNRQYGASHDIDYRSVMPTNLYGPGDNYHPDNSHVIPGLIRRFHEAKASQTSKVTMWGTVIGTAANVGDVTQVHDLLHGEEAVMFAAAGYLGATKRPEAAGVNWHVAMGHGKRRALDKQTKLGALLDKAEKLKGSMRSKVEHPFRVIKCQFGFTKVRYKGLAKNTAQLITLFALSNLWMSTR